MYIKTPVPGHHLWYEASLYFDDSMLTLVGVGRWIFQLIKDFTVSEKIFAKFQLRVYQDS